MPACQIEDYQDSPEARRELSAWLAETDAKMLTEAVWQKRLAHWWDENPFAAACAERGWMLRHEGRLVGFMGLIPAHYAVAGRAVAAYMASTWRVNEPHRNASLPMFMKLRRLGGQHLIVDSTPTPQVQEIMRRSHWTACCEIERRFVVMGLAGKLSLAGTAWPQLGAGLRVTRELGDVWSLARSFQSATETGKWITLEYLRWFAASPMREHRFVGVVDEAGLLSSYLFVTPTTVRGVSAWMVLDQFTTRGGNEELHALVGEIVRGGVLPGFRPLLTLAAFPGDASWEGTRVLHRRTEHLCHYFLMPEEMKGLAKRTVLAEGDWGL